MSSCHAKPSPETPPAAGTPRFDSQAPERPGERSSSPPICSPSDLVVDGKVLAKAGTPVRTIVTYVRADGRFSKPGYVTVRLELHRSDGPRSGLHSTAIRGEGKECAREATPGGSGGGAGIGAMVGGLPGDKKGRSSANFSVGTRARAGRCNREAADKTAADACALPATAPAEALTCHPQYWCIRCFDGLGTREERIAPVCRGLC